MEPIIAIALVLIGYSLGSAKIINQGNEALVERLGQYHRKLRPRPKLYRSPYRPGCNGRYYTGTDIGY